MYNSFNSELLDLILNKLLGNIGYFANKKRDSMELKNILFNSEDKHHFIDRILYKCSDFHPIESFSENEQIESCSNCISNKVCEKYKYTDLQWGFLVEILDTLEYNFEISHDINRSIKKLKCS